MFRLFSVVAVLVASAVLSPVASAQTCTTLALSHTYSSTTCSDGRTSSTLCPSSTYCSTTDNDGGTSSTLCVTSTFCTTTTDPAPPPPTVYVQSPPPPPVTVYVPVPAQPNPPVATAPTAPPPGLDVRLIGGGTQHIPQLAFVKGDDSPAIFVVWNQALFIFPDWQTFLGCGGAANLSNVWSTSHVDAGLVGGTLPSRVCSGG